jgi:hypothetical protein
MHNIEIAGLQFRYLAGIHSVGIISPRGRKYRFPLNTVQSNPRFRVQNGTSDGRVSPQEIADFILKRHLK